MDRSSSSTDNGEWSVRRMFIRNLVLTASVGVYAYERTVPRRIRVNLDCFIWENSIPLIGDHLDHVICYQTLLETVRTVIADRHVNLIETLAERVATACLQDMRVRSVKVRIEKLDLFTDVDSVGIEIERFNCPG